MRYWNIVDSQAVALEVGATCLHEFDLAYLPESAMSKPKAKVLGGTLLSLIGNFGVFKQSVSQPSADQQSACRHGIQPSYPRRLKHLQTVSADDCCSCRGIQNALHSAHCEI